MEKSLKNLRYLISKHPIISPIEIIEAFDFKNLNEVEKFIAPLVESKEILIENVHHGYFIKINHSEECFEMNYKNALVKIKDKGVGKNDNKYWCWYFIFNCFWKLRHSFMKVSYLV